MSRIDTFLEYVRTNGARENLALASDVISIVAAFVTAAIFIALKTYDAAWFYKLFYVLILVPVPLAIALLLLYPLTEKSEANGAGLVPTRTSTWWGRSIISLLAINFFAIFAFLIYDYFHWGQ